MTLPVRLATLWVGIADNWDTSPLDCYWLNREPDWGRIGDAGDDPRLEIDDVDGLGPEAVAYRNPEELGYRVGVYYFSDHNLGESRPTIVISSQGTVLYEREGDPLTSQQFWEVTTIEWGPEPRITEIDQIHDGLP